MTTGYQRPRTKPRSNCFGGAGDAVDGKPAMPKDALIDLAETELAEIYALPGAELAPEEMEREILAQQADEFTCSSCFLVRHRSQLKREKNGQLYCRDCEG